MPPTPVSKIPESAWQDSPSLPWRTAPTTRPRVAIPGCSRRFDFFVTDERLREIDTYADGIAARKRYIVSAAAVDLDGDSVVGDGPTR
jgi:hypothetical protein